MISHAKLNLLINHQAIQQEVKAMPQIWNNHFNTNHYTGEWTALSLRSPGGEDQIVPDLIGDQEYRDTLMMEHCPSVKELVESLACSIMSVRFLNLKAGAVIKPHRDHELAFEKGEARLHFPVFTNPEVEFYIEDERIRMKEGECWYINANLTHRVSNYSKTDRIHLVIDCQVNDWLKELFERSEKFCKMEYQDNSQQLQVIEELRLQNTNVANNLADKLELSMNKK